MSHDSPESQPNLEAAAAIVKVPEGAVPEYGIVVVSYLDSEGEPKFGIQTCGDGNYTSIVGLMQMAGHYLFHLANPSPCERDDDEDS